MALLTSDEITAQLRRVADWRQTDQAIRRQFAFSSFLEAIRFVNTVAALAEAADHHPDIDIRFKRVTMTLSTHSAGGLTVKDFALAEQIDRAAAAGH